MDFASRTEPTEQEVRAAAADLIRPEYVEEWLASRNKMLDGRSPLDLMAAGEGRRVMDLIDFLCSGAFA